MRNFILFALLLAVPAMAGTKRTSDKTFITSSATGNLFWVTGNNTANTASIMGCTNKGTGHGLYVEQDAAGVLAADKAAILVNLSGAQTTGKAGAWFNTVSNTSTIPTVHISNEGTGHALEIQQTEAHASNKNTLHIETTVAQTAGNAAVYVRQGNASTTVPNAYFDNTGTGYNLYSLNRTGIAGSKSNIHATSTVAQTTGAGMIWANLPASSTIANFRSSHAGTGSHFRADDGSNVKAEIYNNGSFVLGAVGSNSTIAGSTYFSPGTGSDINAWTAWAGTATGTVRTLYRNSSQTKSFEIDANFTSGSEAMVLQSEAKTIMILNGATGYVRFPNYGAGIMQMDALGNVSSGTIARTNLPSVGQQISTTTSGAYAVTSSMADVTNATVTITTSGRPVMLKLISGHATAGFGGRLELNGGTNPNLNLQFVRDGTYVDSTSVACNSSTSVVVPAQGFSSIDTPTAGTYVYKLQAQVTGSGSTAYVNNVKLVAYEL